MWYDRKATLQVVGRLAKASEKRDLLVLNFGLHFSESYKDELEELVQQVSTHSLTVLYVVPVSLSCSLP